MKVTLELAWNAFLTAAVVTLLAGLFVAAMPPVYRATATVQGNDNGQLLIQSADLLGQVLRETSADYKNLKGWYEQWVVAPKDPERLLASKLTVTRGSADDWIEISVEAGEPATAAVFTNDIARAYLNRINVDNFTMEERTRLMQQVQAADDLLAEYLTAHPKVARIDAELSRLDQQLIQIADREERLNLNASDLASRLEIAQSGQAGGLEDANVSRQIGRLQQLRDQLLTLQQRYGSQHRTLQGHQQKIAEAEKAVSIALDDYRLRLLHQQGQLSESFTKLDEERAQVQQRYDELLLHGAEYEALSLRRETALKGLQGMAEDDFAPAFEEAVPGVQALGISQATLLVSLFGSVFMVIFLLSFVHWRTLDS